MQTNHFLTLECEPIFPTMATLGWVFVIIVFFRHVVSLADITDPVQKTVEVFVVGLVAELCCPLEEWPSS